MSTLFVEPQKKPLEGAVKVPASKSHSLRALLFSQLAEGACQLSNILEDSPDCKAMQGVVTKIGGSINAGNSGIVGRFLTALAALSPQKTTIDGDESLRTLRPFAPLVDALRTLGARVDYLGIPGHAPLAIQGPVKGRFCHVDGTDSQTVSSLLIALCLAEHDTEIVVGLVGERPWVNLTLSWLDFLKLRYERHGFERFFIYGRQKIEPFSYTVPGDFSSALFLAAAAQISGGRIELEGLDWHDVQGDKDAFALLGQPYFDVDIDAFVDALPILTVLGCFAEGPCTLRGIEKARCKESDRPTVMVQQLRRMGARIEEKNDALVIYPSALHGAKLESCGDHRIAMSLTCAALGATRPSEIQHFSCVKKTYARFVEDICSVGGVLQCVSH